MLGPRAQRQRYASVLNLPTDIHSINTQFLLHHEFVGGLSVYAYDIHKWTFES
jgi:hypothetical protein